MANLTKKKRNLQSLNAYRQSVYETKLKEYEAMTIEELKELFNGPKRIGGVYRAAMMEVVQKKLTEKALKEAEENKVESTETSNTHEPSTTENTDDSLQSESTTESVQETTD
mgnify:CR=1 FL=1